VIAVLFIDMTKSKPTCARDREKSLRSKQKSKFKNIVKQM